jgi:hypothetical protein
VEIICIFLVVFIVAPSEPVHAFFPVSVPSKASEFHILDFMLSSAGNHFSELGLSSVQDIDFPNANMPRSTLPASNMQTLNQVNDNIDRVVDATAEQVRATFENFLHTYVTANLK